MCATHCRDNLSHCPSCVPKRTWTTNLNRTDCQECNFFLDKKSTRTANFVLPSSLCNEQKRKKTNCLLKTSYNLGHDAAGNDGLLVTCGDDLGSLENSLFAAAWQVLFYKCRGRHVQQKCTRSSMVRCLSCPSPSCLCSRVMAAFWEVPSPLSCLVS